MSDIRSIVPSYLEQASLAEKEVFFQVLMCLAAADGHTDETETQFIAEAAQSHGINDIKALSAHIDETDLIEKVKIIKNRHLALELIREMCILSHVDSLLSDEETLFIGKIGIALGIEMEKIEQISNWVIDHIIWLEMSKVIFEEK